MTQLRDYLKDSRKTPSALAKELGVQPSTITRIVRGERQPSDRPRAGRPAARCLRAHAGSQSGQRVRRARRMNMPSPVRAVLRRLRPAWAGLFSKWCCSGREPISSDAPFL